MVNALVSAVIAGIFSVAAAVAAERYKQRQQRHNQPETDTGRDVGAGRQARPHEFPTSAPVPSPHWTAMLALPVLPIVVGVGLGYASRTLLHDIANGLYNWGVVLAFALMIVMTASFVFEHRDWPFRRANTVFQLKNFSLWTAYAAGFQVGAGGWWDDVINMSLGWWIASATVGWLILKIMDYRRLLAEYRRRLEAVGAFERPLPGQAPGIGAENDQAGDRLDDGQHQAEPRVGRLSDPVVSKARRASSGERPPAKAPAPTKARRSPPDVRRAVGPDASRPRR